jgi:pimeloyl-ACP methyl ester carboxylesterase
VTNLAYDDRGSGEPVLFISGSGGPGRTWHIHQVPAFTAAGYRAVTFDNRGVGATENEDGFTTETMVADTAELIEQLGLAPTNIVGASMGAYVAQELMLARPELVKRAALLGTCGRVDRAREFFRSVERELADSGIRLPTAYHAKVRLLEGFSPETLNDDRAIAEWIDMFTLFPTQPTAGQRRQLEIGPHDSRLPAYRSITARVLVIGFANDLVMPPHLGKEVADAMPNGRFVRIAHTGHLGFLERPEAVNAAILQFFADLLL